MNQVLLRSVVKTSLLGLWAMTGCEAMTGAAEMQIDARVNQKLSLGLVGDPVRLSSEEDLELLGEQACEVRVEEAPEGAMISGMTLEWTPTSVQTGYHAVVIRYSRECLALRDTLEEVVGITVWDDSGSQSAGFEDPSDDLPDVHDFE